MNKKVLNILMLGDLIGEPGLKQIFTKLCKIKSVYNVDFTVANGENSDNGFGITEDIVNSMKKYGVDVITSGNHIWSNKDSDQLLDKYEYLLRPANYSDAAGKGYVTLNVLGIEISVVNISGRYFMTPIDCPFQTLNKLLKKELRKSSIIVVDFHAEYPAEKQALAFDFDGVVSIVAGTHTHVQTADEKILPGGTGYITDLGMCGGIDSIIGMKKEAILKKMKNQISIPFKPAEENSRIQGAVFTVDIESGKTIAIKRINQ